MTEQVTQPRAWIWGKNSFVVQLVKNLPAVQETWVCFLGSEDPLEEGMATHSSILAWRIPWTEKPGRLQSMSLQKVVYDHFGPSLMVGSLPSGPSFFSLICHL